MFTYVRKAGTADVSVVIRIIDATDGTPETGVVYNTSGIDLQYRREGATSTAITEATLAGLDAAHADGGFLHIGNGYYRLDLPDAACAASAVGVLVHGTVTGMVVIGCYVQLVTYDPFDSVRLGLTALPNAGADAAGGLPISDAGGLDLDAKLAATNEVTAARMGALTDLINDGRLDLLIDAIKAKTDTLPAAPAAVGDIPTATVIADQVWDEAAAGHIAAGSMGEEQQAHALSSEIAALNDLSSADIATAILGAVVEGTITMQQATALFLAVLTGKSSGGGTGTITFRNTADSKNRIVATVDANNNRTVIGTRDGT